MGDPSKRRPQQCAVLYCRQHSLRGGTRWHCIKLVHTVYIAQSSCSTCGVSCVSRERCLVVWTLCRLITNSASTPAAPGTRLPCYAGHHERFWIGQVCRSAVQQHAATRAAGLTDSFGGTPLADVQGLCQDLPAEEKHPCRQQGRFRSISSDSSTSRHTSSCAQCTP